MSTEVSISLEETNKIRLSLGLKPLTDKKAPANNQEKQAEANYAKKRDEEAKASETKRIQDNIAKVKNKRELHASLQGKTLGDADGGADSALQWIKRAKKKEKELARKRAQEYESMDKVTEVDSYTEKDLVGLKVSHDFDAMDEGEEHILTLKDSRILDDAEDELQNVEMAEEEHRQKRADLKIKKRDYTGYDDDEFVSGNEGMKRKILAKYDEDIEGIPDQGFRLGSSAAPKNTRAEKEQAAASVNKSLLSIDYNKNIETVDYLQEGDIGFKKPKTKKKRSSRRVPEESDTHPPDTMDVDEKHVIRPERNLDANFVDDDELQAALARSRQAKLQKPKKLSPEEVAKKIAEQRKLEEDAATAPVSSQVAVKVEDIRGDEDDGGLTFDDTSEFVRSISYAPAVVKAEPVDDTTSKSETRHRSPSREAMEVDETIEELEAGEVVMEEGEEDEDDEAMLNAIEDAIKATEAEEAAAEAGVGTSTEQTFNAGMASTLSILRQQGILATPTADQKEREQVQLQRDLWLANQRRRIAQREMDRSTLRGTNRDQTAREYENRLREQQDVRESLETFKDYKPDINIVYYDEFGRALTPKEAWKALSHKFHGKGSGKMKTEKRLKKIADERKKEAMASGDTPLSMNKAFQIRQQKTGQAHFVMSVGNRGAVPQAAEFLDPQPLSKGKTERNKQKKKNAAKGNVPTTQASFITLQPLPNGSEAAISSISTPKSESPVPPAKPGFSRISADSPSVSQSGTPLPAGGSKLVLGFGAKRKATDEAEESPTPKRR